MDVKSWFGMEEEGYITQGAQLSAWDDLEEEVVAGGRF